MSIELKDTLIYRLSEQILNDLYALEDELDYDDDNIGRAIAIMQNFDAEDACKKHMAQVKEEIMILQGPVDVDVLTEIMNRKVYWSEIVVPGYIRVHYDQERYLPVYEDVPVERILKYTKENS